MFRTGLTVSTVNINEAVFVLPALSVALTMMVCEPSAREVNVSLVPDTVLHEPLSNLISVWTMPEPGSEVVHFTITPPVLLYDPAVGEVMLMTGATVSITKLAEAELTFPALSVTLTVTL
jgi:hypothetical protein